MAIIIFLLGITIGSFLNVCIYRIPKGESLVFPTSHCIKCNTPLKWYNLIPIISFILQKGRCRYCREAISLQYPVVELLTGIILTILYFNIGINIDFIYYLFLFSLLIIITFIDIKHQIIPDGLILSILIGTILYKSIQYLLFDVPINLLNGLIGFIISSLFFLIIIIVSKGGMGGGDLKLIGVFGFILGFPEIILNIFLSFIIGGMVSILLLAFKIKGRKDPIPFGPFIILGFIVTLFWGTCIISWYINSLF